MTKITRARAERVARAHACEHCGEYSYKKLTVKPAPAGNRTELNEAWVAKKTCGVCGLQAELGIDAEGEIVWVTQP
jgi:transcription elongation factor Elf1